MRKRQQVWGEQGPERLEVPDCGLWHHTGANGGGHESVDTGAERRAKTDRVLWRPSAVLAGGVQGQASNWMRQFAERHPEVAAAPPICGGPGVENSSVRPYDQRVTPWCRAHADPGGDVIGGHPKRFRYATAAASGGRGATRWAASLGYQGGFRRVCDPQAPPWWEAVPGGGHALLWNCGRGHGGHVCGGGVHGFCLAPDPFAMRCLCAGYVDE